MELRATLGISLLFLTLISVSGLIGSAAADEPMRLTEQQRQALTEESKKLGQEALRLDKEGKVTEAIKVAEQLLVHIKRIQGDAHLDVAVLLTWLAVRYEQLDDFVAAAAARDEILKNTARRLGDSHWEVIDCRIALANVKLLASLNANDRRQLAIANERNDEGVRLHKAAKYQEALQAAEDVEKIRKSILGENHVHYAVSVNNLAAAYREIGNFGKAQALYEKALDIEKTLLGEAHPDYARSLHQVASSYYLTRDFGKALPLFIKSAEIFKSTLGENHRDFVVGLDSVAKCCRLNGYYVGAERLSRVAMEVARDSLGTSHLDYAEQLVSLAEILESRGDLSRAEPLYVEALQVTKSALGEAHPTYATRLSNLANVYSSMDDARAEQLYRDALSITKQAFGEAHFRYATSLNNLANWEMSKGNYAEAERMFLRVVDINKKALGESDPLYAKSVHNLARLYARTGDYSRAEPLYRESSEIAKHVLGETHTDYGVFLGSLAALYENAGEYLQAVQLRQQGLKIVERNLQLVADVQSERQQLAASEAVRYQLDALVSIAIKAKMYGPEAFEEALSWQGQVLRRQRAIRAVAHEPGLESTTKELRSVSAQLATFAITTPNAGQQVAWRTQIAELSARKEQLEAELASASKDFRKNREPSRVGDVQAALPKGSALIDWLNYWSSDQAHKKDGGGVRWERKTAAFVLRHDGAVELVDLGLFEPIKEAIEAWRVSQGSSEEAQRAASVLRELVWAPIEEKLRGATTVFVSPDGEFGRLPFGALPSKEEGRYLIEEYTIALVPSPQALVEYRRQEKPSLVVQADDKRDGTRSVPATLLLLGDVEYDRRPSAGEGKNNQPSAAPASREAHARAARDDKDAPFSSLPGTREELAIIQRMHGESFGNGGVLILKSTGASKDALVREAPLHANLHLATHAYFAAARYKSALAQSANDLKMLSFEIKSDQSLSGYHPGLLSGLVLAGANQPDESDDGILTAEEVSSLNLSKTELVVLSACETGLGKTAGGEGLLGLQRAFQAAGAHTVVASLWSVPDQATKALMVRFYDNLWKKKMGKLEALREAQLWMLNHGAEQPEIRRELVARGLKEFEGATNAPKSNRLPPYYWAAWVLSGDWR
jgi:CHAT domain-containing protein/tetratricopeptide (TPR) repeat protein